MPIYILRHGQDDSTVRGGWSNASLNETGRQEIRNLAKQWSGKQFSKIYASDLPRTVETVKILLEEIRYENQINFSENLREVNNGQLAGMKNELAAIKFPGLYWNQLEWEEQYPDGESPMLFYERIKKEWFKILKENAKSISNEKDDILIITHSGVMHVILSITENRLYSNKEKQRSIRTGSYIIINSDMKEINN